MASSTDTKVVAIIVLTIVALFVVHFFPAVSRHVDVNLTGAVGILTLRSIFQWKKNATPVTKKSESKLLTGSS